MKTQNWCFIVKQTSSTRFNNPVTMGTEYMDSISIDKSSPASAKEERTCLQQAARIAKQNLLVIFLLFGIIAGAAVGIGLRTGYPDFSDSKRNAMYIGFPGNAFIE